MSFVSVPGSASRRSDQRFRAGRILPAVGLVLCAGALIACSSTTATTTGTTAASSSSVAVASPGAATSYPAGKEQLCQARDQLKISVTALTSPALLTGGAEGIKTALAQVQTDLQGLLAAGKQDYQPQIEAVQSSLKDVETAVGQLANGGGAQNMLAAGSAISATGTSAAALFKELTTACGS